MGWIDIERHYETHSGKISSGAKPFFLKYYISVCEYYKILNKGGDIMCCTTDSHHGIQRWRRQHACACGCLGVEFPRPRFITKTQQIASLQKHLEDLQNETKAVEEQLAEINKNAVL
jgi:hypothetical protein